MPTAPAPRRVPPEPEEATLVRRAQAGDAAAFEDLVRVHAPRVLALARRLGLDPAEAEEAAQETMVRAWRALPRFEARSALGTWLHAITVNEAHRRRGPRGSARAGSGGDERLLLELVDRAPGPERLAQHRELNREMAHALRRLPATLREPVVLRDLDGLSVAEAARALGLGEAAFKIRLRRGRVALRSGLVPPDGATRPAPRA